LWVGVWAHCFAFSVFFRFTPVFSFFPFFLFPRPFPSLSPAFSLIQTQIAGGPGKAAEEETEEYPTLFLFRGNDPPSWQVQPICDIRLRGVWGN